MLKVLVLLIAAALAFAAQAQSVPRHFSFTGFYHVEAAQFLPDASLGGYFESEDADHSGTIERSEVSSFVLGGQQYVGNCGELFICGLFEFAYRPGGALNFYTSWGTDPWGEYTAGGRVRTGVEAVSYSNFPPAPSRNTYLWTDQTRFSIAPVPEPANYLLLALGLAVFAIARRRTGRVVGPRPARPARPAPQSRAIAIAAP